MRTDAHNGIMEREGISDELALGRFDIEAGRTRPAREVLAELREKYGFASRNK